VTIEPTTGQGTRLSSATERIAEIQLIRGIAVIATIFAHSFTHFPQGYSNPGWLGVMMFFVISGFVVSRSLDAGQWRSSPFLIKRAFRLIPVLAIYIIAAGASLYFFSGVDGWPLGPVKESEIIVQSLVGLLDAQSITLIMGINPPIDMGHLWSLSVEDIFYASLALAVALITALLVTPKRTLGICGLVFAFLLIVLRFFWAVTGRRDTLFGIHASGGPGGLAVIYNISI
jgi:peptidoglycan/LPS O-acetylase OafA/YrhL